MFYDDRFLRLMLGVLVAFVPAYLWLAIEFFKAGDPQIGWICLAWTGLLGLAVRCILAFLNSGEDK